MVSEHPAGNPARWWRKASAYDLVSGTFAVVLLIAAGLKAHLLLSSNSDRHAPWLARLRLQRYRDVIVKPRL